MEQVCIQIKNADKLQKGCQSYYLFTNFGGTIGSGEECCWIVQDTEGKVLPEHIRISYEEDCFGICPTKDAKVFLNGSFSSLLPNYTVAITVGDSFSIGDLNFVVKPPEEAKKLAEDASLALENIKNYDELDTMSITPKGRIDNFDAEDDVARGILDDNEDVLDITPIDEEFDFSDTSRDFSGPNNQRMTKKIIFDMVEQIMEDVKAASLERKGDIGKLEDNASILPFKDVKYMTDHIPFIKSPRVINAILLSFLFNELSNPLLSEIDGGYLEKIISKALEETMKDDFVLMERLSVIALEKYLER